MDEGANPCHIPPEQFDAFAPETPMKTTPIRFVPLLAALVLAPACAQDAEPETSLERAEIEDIVREYILSNPEIIEEALIELGERQRQAEADAARAAVAANADDLFRNEADFFIGPADAPVTVVEFFDYRCGFCKRSLDYVAALPAAHDGQVRVVFKEFPILSPESRQAALAALAAGRQGKYFEMHAALMDSASDKNDEDIDAIAREIGLDIAKMRADMRSTAVQQQLADHTALARTLGLNATPTFVIGNELVQGADTAQIDRLIAARLEG